MPLALVLVAAAVAALVAMLVLAEAKRTRAWRVLAAERGWQLGGREPGLGRFGRFRACRTGEQHEVLRRAFGPLDGARVDLAELTHFERDRVAPAKSRHTVQTACLIEDPALHLPAFFARPSSLLDQLGRMADLKDIAFPDDPAFSAALLLQGDDDAVRARFDAPSRAWLARRADRRWSYEGVGDALLVVAPRPLPEAELRELLSAALELAGLWRSPDASTAQEPKR